MDHAWRTGMGTGRSTEAFRSTLSGHLSLEPKNDELRVIEVHPNVVHIFVPITFMIAPAGQTAQPTRFLMNQVVVRMGDGWKIASILPIPAPQQ